MKRLATVLFVVAVTSALLLPSAALLVLDGRTERSDLVPRVTPVEQPMRVVSVARSFDGFLRLTQLPARRLRTLDTAGVVTGVVASPERAVTMGSDVFQVDGATIVAFASSFPLYRILALGDSGADVVGLQALLAARGLYAGDIDGVFDAETHKSVRTFESTTGRGRTGRFDPSWTLWIGSDSVVPASIDVEVGQRVSDGQAVMTLASPPTIVEAEDAAGELTHVFDGLETAYNGTVIGVVVDGAAPSPSQRLVTQMIASGETAPSTTSSAIGSSVVRVPATFRAEPTAALVVAASAVVESATAEGRSWCIWLADGPDAYRSVSIELLDPDPSVAMTGTTLIAPINETGNVLVNPSETLDELSCS